MVLSRFRLGGGFTSLDACTAATTRLLSYSAHATCPATFCRCEAEFLSFFLSWRFSRASRPSASAALVRVVASCSPVTGALWGSCNVSKPISCLVSSSRVRRCTQGSLCLSPRWRLCPAGGGLSGAASVSLLSAGGFS